MRLTSNGDSMHDNSFLISVNDGVHKRNKWIFHSKWYFIWHEVSNLYGKKVRHYINQLKSSTDSFLKKIIISRSLVRPTPPIFFSFFRKMFWRLFRIYNAKWIEISKVSTFGMCIMLQYNLVYILVLSKGQIKGLIKATIILLSCMQAHQS